MVEDIRWRPACVVTRNGRLPSLGARESTNQPVEGEGRPPHEAQDEQGSRGGSELLDLRG